MTATGTELLTELVDERTRLLAEVERLRARVTELEAPVRKRDYGATDADGIPLNDGNAISMLYDTLAENERLRARVLDLEAKVAILCGSLARHAVEDDQPAIIHHDVKPNAPR